MGKHQENFDQILEELAKISSGTTTTEHLFYVIIKDRQIYEYLTTKNTNVDAIIKECENNLDLPIEAGKHHVEDISANLKEIIQTFHKIAEETKHQLPTCYVFLYLLLINPYSKDRVAGVLKAAGCSDVSQIIQNMSTSITSKIVTTSTKFSQGYTGLDYGTGYSSTDRPKLTITGGVHGRIYEDEESEVYSESKSKKTFPYLNKYCTNLNEQIKNNPNHRIINRDNYVNQIAQAVSRKTKQNVILVGDAGVGKTAIVESFVSAILRQELPEDMNDKIVYSLDIAGLVAGARYRGDFEERMIKLIEEVSSLPDVILFVDEIHMLKDAGATNNSPMDATNILKPALSSGKIRVIGATTHEEYRQYFEKDKAITRRFLKVGISEPTVEETKMILRNSISSFENYHKIIYDKDAVDLAVDLSNRYMTSRRFPDKAFDVIDSAGARVKLFEKEKDSISKEDVRKEVSIMTKIPNISETEEQTVDYKSLETRIKNKVYGQDEAISSVVDYVIMSKSGLRNSSKPILSSLLRGQTGVGKTEFSKILAEELNVPFLRFDMSEYQEPHSVSKLIGAPPGYVGHGEGASGAGLLINAIETSPNCVLLLDEIEKAHPDVLSILLQVMDYGKLTSSNGKEANFRNCIVLMSSNLGAREMTKKSIGFNTLVENNDHDVVATNQFFSPEFRNRLDLIVSFQPLSEKALLSIVDKHVFEMNNMLKDKKISLKFSKSAKMYFVEQTKGLHLGARPVANLIEKKVKNKLSKMIVFGEVSNNTKLDVDLIDDEIVIKNKKLELQF